MDRILVIKNREIKHHPVLDLIYKIVSKVYELSNDSYYNLNYRSPISEHYIDEKLEENFDIDRILDEVNRFDIFIIFDGFQYKSTTLQIGAALSRRKEVILLNQRYSSINANIRANGLTIFDIDNYQYHLEKGIYFILNQKVNNLLSYDNIRRNINFATYTDTFSSIKRAINFNDEVINYFNRAFDSNIQLKENVPNSWKSLFEIKNLDKLFELIEKLIFIKPEWEKRKQEIKALELKNKKSEIEILKEMIELRQKENFVDFERMIKMLEIIEKYKDLGYRKIQFSEELLLKVDEDNNISFVIPPKIDK